MRYLRAGYIRSVKLILKYSHQKVDHTIRDNNGNDIIWHAKSGSNPKNCMNLLKIYT